MAKKWEISYLLDFYGDVLTEKQRDVMVQYYNDDYSLAEIAENFGITRQGVRDAIKRGEATLLELEEKINRLQAELSAEQQTAVDAEKWVALIKQYANPTELTAELLNTLIEKIVIHEATKGADGMRDQEIEIYYRFIGKID